MSDAHELSGDPYHELGWDGGPVMVLPTEAEEAYADGDEEHMVKEAADAVLVAFQFMRSCGSAPPHHYVHERMQKARDRGIQSEIVPKYREWYQAEQAGGSR